ncbi:MAG TPA: alpha/beta hydrolase, partial [Candidatus Nanoarchaeia archaeon]|nr:alpha/beta hydrolase [Candidatus Nanoarchaeia archaeon]
MQLIILHGFGARPDSNFFQWLKNKFPNVHVPQLPDTDNPSEEQVDFVLKNIEITKDTVLLGHSLGAVVAL